jgi:hypothetical protein
MVEFKCLGFLVDLFRLVGSVLYVRGKIIVVGV